MWAISELQRALEEYLPVVLGLTVKGVPTQPAAEAGQRRPARGGASSCGIPAAGGRSSNSSRRRRRWSLRPPGGRWGGAFAGAAGGLGDLRRCCAVFRDSGSCHRCWRWPRR